MIKLTPEKAPYYEIVEQIKTYIARITQETTEAPIPTIHKNNIGEIIWSRVNTGSYKGTLAGKFKLDKTIIQATLETGSNGISVRANCSFDENSIEITTVDDTNSNIDDNYWSLQISIYP